MSKSVVVTARVTAETAAALDALAARLDRSRAWIVNKAIADHVRAYTEFLDFLQEGEDSIDRGEFYTQEEMEEWIASLKRAKAA